MLLIHIYIKCTCITGKQITKLTWALVLAFDSGTDGKLLYAVHTLTKNALSIAWKYISIRDDLVMPCTFTRMWYCYYIKLTTVWAKFRTVCLSLLFITSISSFVGKFIMSHRQAVSIFSKLNNPNQTTQYQQYQ